MTELAELAQTLRLEDHLILGALVLARVAPLVWLTPFLGGAVLSAAIRTTAALALTIVLLPSALGEETLELSNMGIFVVLLLKEAVIGVSLGLLALVTFHTLSMAGQLVDQSRGVSSSQIENPFAGEGQSPLASLNLMLGVVVFLIIGGHRAFLVALAGSYEIIPVGQLPLSPLGLQSMALAMIQLMGWAFAAALMLAAPAVVAILLTDIALGLLGRTAPQLGTYFLAMPLRAALGLTMTLLALSIVFYEMVPYLGELNAAVGRVVELLGNTG